MALKGDNYTDLCKKLNIYSATLYSKLRGQTEFKQGEMQIILKEYDLTPDEFVEIFLSGDVE